MASLSLLEKKIIEHTPKKPIHKGMIRREVKCRTEFTFGRLAFQSQIEALVDHGIIQDHDGDYYSLREDSLNDQGLDQIIVN